MKTEDLLFMGIIGVVLYFVLKGQQPSSASAVTPGSVVPGMPSPIAGPGWMTVPAATIQNWCPPGITPATDIGIVSSCKPSPPGVPPGPGWTAYGPAVQVPIPPVYTGAGLNISLPSQPAYDTHVAGAPAPLLGYQCPPGQFMFHTGPLGLGPGYCSSTLPDVLS